MSQIKITVRGKHGDEYTFDVEKDADDGQLLALCELEDGSVSCVASDGVQLMEKIMEAVAQYEGE